MSAVEKAEDEAQRVAKIAERDRKRVKKEAEEEAQHVAKAAERAAECDCKRVKKEVEEEAQRAAKAAERAAERDRKRVEKEAEEEAQRAAKPSVKTGPHSSITWTADVDATIVKMIADDVPCLKIASKLGNGLSENDIRNRCIEN